MIAPPDASSTCESVGALAAAIVLAAALAALLAAFYILPFTVLLPLATQVPKVEAAPLFIGTEMANFLLGMPIWPLQVGIGYVFGVGHGFFIALAGYVLSSLPPYFLAPVLLPACKRVLVTFDRLVVAPLRGRCFGNRLDVCAASGRSGLLDGLALTIERRPFELVLAMRLNLVPPAGLTSYAFGGAGVPFRTYIAATALGTMPNTLAYCYLGSLLDSIAQLVMGGQPEFDSRGTALMATAFAASVALMVFLSRLAARRLKEARQEQGG